MAHCQRPKHSDAATEYLKRALLLPICLLVVGCEDDFGDRAMNFVNDEVHGLSRAHVEATVDNVLSQAFVGVFENLTAEAKLALFVGQDYKSKALTIDPGSTTDKDLLLEFEALDKQAGTIIRLKAGLERGSGLLERLDGLCTSLEVFDSLHLGEIGGQGPAGVVMAALAQQKAEVRVSASGGNAVPWYVSVGEGILSLFGASQTENQNRILEDAIHLVPSRIVQREEALEIFQARCKDQYVLWQADFVQLKEEIKATDEALTRTLTAVQASRGIIGAIIRTRDISHFLSATGVSDIFSTVLNLIARGEVWTDIQLALDRLDSKRRRILELHECTAALTAIEDYEDNLIELQAQVDVLSTTLGGIDAISDRLIRSSHQLGQDISQVPERYALAKAILCN